MFEGESRDIRARSGGPLVLTSTRLDMDWTCSTANGSRTTHLNTVRCWANNGRFPHWESVLATVYYTVCYRAKTKESRTKKQACTPPYSARKLGTRDLAFPRAIGQAGRGLRQNRPKRE